MTFGVVMAAVLLGCSGSQADEVGVPPARQDSAGVELVLNAAIKDAPQVVIFATADVVDVGGLDDDPDLELLVKASHDGLRLKDGAILVANGYDLRRYRSDGTLERKIGARGGGPGEFQSQVWGLCLGRGDTVLALEVPDPRIGITDSRLSSLVTERYSGHAFHRGCTSEGFLAAIGEITFREVGDSPVVEVGVIAPDGETVASIGHLPSDDHTTIFSHEAAVASWGGYIAATDGDQFEFRMYSPRGHVYRIVRTGDPPLYLSRDEVEAMVRMRLPPNVSEASAKEEAQRTLKGQDRIAAPAFVRLSVDGKGRAWLSERRELGGPPEQWAVFDSTGALLGTANPNDAVPPGGERAIVIRWTAQDLVLKYRDADGALHIRFIPYSIEQ